MHLRTRRILAVATVGLMSTAACGSGKSTDTGSKSNGGVTASSLPKCPVDAFKKASGTTEVVFWHSYVGNTLAALTKIVDAYNASQSKVRVRLENQGQDYKELRRNFEAAATAKQLPALVGGEDTWTQYMIDNGLTMPAQACINDDSDPRAKVSDVLPGVKAAYTVGGVQWPAAYGASTIMLYFNEDHFRKAGLDPANPPRTLAELRTAAEKLKAAGVSGGAPFAMKLDPWFIENMSSAVGQTVVNHDNGRDGNRATASTLKNPKLTNILNWLAGMKRDGLLNAIPRRASSTTT
ncbi:MAG: extracellular solute-binding protein [Microthrixaceae bacterium]